MNVGVQTYFDSADKLRKGEDDKMRKLSTIRKATSALITALIIALQLCGCSSKEQKSDATLSNETTTVEKSETQSTSAKESEAQTETKTEVQTESQTETQTVTETETESESEASSERNIDDCIEDAREAGVIPEDKLDLLREAIQMYLDLDWDIELAYKQAVIDVDKSIDEDKQAVGNGQGEGIETEEWMNDWAYNYRLYPGSTNDQKALFNTEEEFMEAIKNNGYDGRFFLNSPVLNILSDIWIRGGVIYYTEEEYLAAGGTEEAKEEVTTSSDLPWVVILEAFGKVYSYATEEELMEVLLKGSGDYELKTPTYCGPVWIADGKLFYDEEEYYKYLDPDYGVDPFVDGNSSTNMNLNTDTGKGVKLQ